MLLLRTITNKLNNIWVVKFGEGWNNLREFLRGSIMEKRRVDFFYGQYLVQNMY